MTMTLTQPRADDRPAIAPRPGIYRNIPAATYHALPAISSSQLKAMKTPAHLRYYLDNPPEPSDAMQIGTAVNCGVLEKEVFAATWRPAPKFDRRTTIGKADAAKWDAECMANGTQTLPPDDWEIALRMIAAVRDNPSAWELLMAKTDVELSVVWIDDATGQLCKSRNDLIVGNATWADLKTTRDASPEGFSREVYNYNYHIQAAHYLRGLAAHGIVPEKRVFVAVQAKPYFCTVIGLDDLWLEAGDEERRRRMLLLKKCREENNWPAYGEGVLPLMPPGWLAKKLELEGSEL